MNIATLLHDATRRVRAHANRRHADRRPRAAARADRRRRIGHEHGHDGNHDGGATRSSSRTPFSWPRTASTSRSARATTRPTRPRTVDWLGTPDYDRRAVTTYRDDRHAGAAAAASARSRRSISTSRRSAAARATQQSQHNQSFTSSAARCSAASREDHAHDCQNTRHDLIACCARHGQAPRASSSRSNAPSSSRSAELTLPTADGGTVSFSECADCAFSTHRLTSATESSQANRQPCRSPSSCASPKMIAQTAGRRDQTRSPVVFLDIETGRVTRVDGPRLGRAKSF